MKLKTPFSVIKNVFSDIKVMHDFNYTTPPETRDEFWRNECDLPHVFLETPHMMQVAEDLISMMN